MRSVLLAVSTAVTLLLAAPGASAQPAPPPNPSDQEIEAGRDAVVGQAAELGRLSLLVADLDRRAGEARTALEDRREQAFVRLVDAENAAVAAAEASDRAAGARVVSDAAGSAVQEAQQRLDEFVTASYQQTLDLGPLGLLTESTAPEDLVARAEFGDLVAREQAGAIDALSRAFVGQVNAESALRAAADEARTRREDAERARLAADAAVEQARVAVDEEEARLRELDAERAGVESRLQALRATEERLRGQRAEYESYRERAARAAEEERRRAAQAASAADSTACPGGVRSSGGCPMPANCSAAASASPRWAGSGRVVGRPTTRSAWRSTSSWTVRRATRWRSARCATAAHSR